MRVELRLPPVNMNYLFNVRAFRQGLSWVLPFAMVMQIMALKLAVWTKDREPVG